MNGTELCAKSFCLPSREKVHFSLVNISDNFGTFSHKTSLCTLFISSYLVVDFMYRLKNLDALDIVQKSTKFILVSENKSVALDAVFHLHGHERV